MRPLRLTLTNYRAFSNADINLDCVEAASVTGTNGAGKSALVESIVYALFSEGRSSGVDGVVRLGADEASVQFDYEHGGNVYRIIRKRSRGKRTDLQYLIADGEGWKPISGSGVRETQERIVADLAMDESLFLNSSCVMQGRSAGICEATPAERKAVLYRILEDRLARFGPLADAAKAQVKSLDDAMTIGRTKIAELEAMVAGREAAEVTLLDTQEALAALRSDLKEVEEALAEHRATVAAQEAQREKIEELGTRRQALSAEIVDLTAQAQRHRAIIDDAQLVLAAADSIRAKAAEADALETQLALLDELREQYNDLIAQHRDRESALQTEEARLRSEAAEELTKVANELHGLRNHAQTDEVRIEKLEEQIDDTRRRAELLEEVPCRTLAIAEECKLLADARTAAGRLGELEARLTATQAELGELTSSITTMEREHKDRQAALDQALETAKQSALADCEVLRGRAKSLCYDKEAHSTKQARLSLVRTARDQLADLAAAEARMEAATAAKDAAETAVAEKEGVLVDLNRELELLLALTPTNVTGKIAELESDQRDLQARIERAVAALAIHEDRIATIDAAAAELEELSESMAAHERQRTLYATLQQAFSRDGIPALIIDAAVPAIEERANEILARLSDGRMTVRFVTQRAKVSGGIAETLDIIVSDEQGERPYEDWSGGEKLRIDLAVRIALGQVLAQRTGAPVELLILDEVCAPLDEAGEEALVDCINRLRESFACILLITHRESLKDRLPQQIVVTKNGAGSEASLVA
jgi:exonuclease SbcC